MLVELDVWSRDALPVHFHLAQDSDVRVRRFVLELLAWRWADDDGEILPVLQRHLDDEDAFCQGCAAFGVWHATKDPELRHKAAALAEHHDPKVQLVAAQTLFGMAEHVPESFEPLAKLCENADSATKCRAMYHLRHFGKRALPVLRRRLNDPNAHVRQGALSWLTMMSTEAAEVAPHLIAMRNDENQEVRETANEALSRINPGRFPPPAK